MRKTFTLTILSILLSSTFLFAQSKATRYCEILTVAKSGSDRDDRVIIKLSLRKIDDYFLLKDTTILPLFKKVITLNTSSDLLNYITKMGWDFVSVIIILNYRRSFFFKKEFDISDFQ
jgi:hypothetical protein